MKIIVVDDHIAAQETVTVALASDPATKHHAVTGVRTPDELHRLDDLGIFGLAFVDLDFRRQSVQTGLFALRVLDRADVPAVIYAADDEDNRVLFLLAAFRFYRPWALVSKRASGAEIRKLVATIESGARPDSSAMRRYQPSHPGHTGPGPAPRPGRRYSHLAGTGDAVGQQRHRRSHEREPQQGRPFPQRVLRRRGRDRGGASPPRTRAVP
jgi:hypothetical protein